MTDHLPPDPREAHNRMLAAWDTLTKSVLRREGPAAEAKAGPEGKTPDEGAQVAQEQVNRLLVEINRERARLGAEAVEHRQRV